MPKFSNAISVMNLTLGVQADPADATVMVSELRRPASKVVIGNPTMNENITIVVNDFARRVKRNLEAADTVSYSVNGGQPYTIICGGGATEIPGPIYSLRCIAQSGAATLANSSIIAQ